MNMRTLRALVMMSLVLPLPASANSETWLKQTIFGMDCAPCAHAVETSLGRLNGVTAVEVSLSDGLAELTLAPDAEPDIGEIRSIVENNGFTPQATELRLRGRLAAMGDDTVLVVGEQRFTLVPTEATQADRLGTYHGGTVAVTGRIAETDTDRLQVNAIESSE